MNQTLNPKSAVARMRKYITYGAKAMSVPTPKMRINRAEPQQPTNAMNASGYAKKLIVANLALLL